MPWLENVKLSPGRIHEGLIDRYREELQKPMKLKRLAVIAFLTLAVMVYFWTVSRYPDLGVKTEVGPDMILDGLGFDVVYPVESGDSYPLQAAKRTVNWMKTNLKGTKRGGIKTRVKYGNQGGHRSIRSIDRPIESIDSIDSMIFRSFENF